MILNIYVVLAIGKCYIGLAMPAENLAQTAKILVAPKKGILAADWSFGTIAKKFAKVKVESTESSRRNYRGMLFSTPGLEKYISGVIFFDETIKQKTKDGKPFPLLLEEKGIVPGVRVDTGQVDLPNFPKEKVTQGLDKFREKLENYYKLGARFTKWRAVIVIGKDIPSKTCIDINSNLFGLYASYCQELGLVPIVEPDVIIEGDHSIARCEEVTYSILKDVFATLLKYQVRLNQMVLKPNIVLPGRDSSNKAEAVEIAERTIRVMKEAVPPEVPGIAFLSGGQTPENSTNNLNEINKLSKDGVPWELSFSYARALQEPVLEVWKGKDENKDKAQKELLKRARLNSLAREGKYDPEMEKDK